MKKKIFITGRQINKMADSFTAEMPEVWMLVRRGHVQRYVAKHDGRQVKTWPVASNHTDANRLAQFFATDGIRAALIGSVENSSGIKESVAGHIRLAIAEGCECAIVVNGWNDDGSPIMNKRFDFFPRQSPRKKYKRRPRQ